MNDASVKRRLFLISFVSVVVFVLAGEGLLQLQYRWQEGRWFAAAMADRQFRVGFTVPVSDRREFSLRPGYTDALYSVNGLGFRGPVLRGAQPHQIICALGDSVPFGYGVRDDETYPVKLQGAFAQAGQAVTVINAGIPSYNLRQSIDRFFLDVRPHYAPQVVTLQAANDVSLLTQYRERWTPDLTWASVRYRKTWQASGLARKLVTVHRLANIDGDREPEVEYYRGYPADALLTFLNEELDSQLQRLTDENIRVILLPISMFTYRNDPGDVRNRELRLWPRWRAHRNVFLPVANAVNDVLRRKAAEHEGVYFLDLGTVLDAHDRDDLFVDGFHYSGRGAEVVAEALFEFIDERQLLDQVAQPAAGAVSTAGST